MKEFYINKSRYSQDELTAFAGTQLVNPHVQEWEKDFFQFILDWFSPGETVSVFTSGSTGRPKEIKLSKTNVIKSARRSLEFFEVRPGENALLCLPLKYIAGMLMVVRAFEGNLNLLTVSPQHLKIDDISVDIGFAALVPLQLEQIINRPGQLNKIKKMILGGAPLSSSLSSGLTAVFEGKAWETYGMTETITHVAVRDVLHDSPRRFHGLPEIEFNVDGNDCLVITDRLIHPEPVITNDRVELISHTEFHLLGRVDNVINSGGVKIQPEEIEAVLASFIAGKFCISSVPDPSLGNMVVLVIEKRADLSLLNEGINKLPQYHRPKKIIEIPEFPLTSSGKTDFKAVKRFLETQKL